MYRYLIFSAALLAAPSLASAKSDKVKDVVSCFPSKDLVKMLGRLDKIDADRRDVVDLMIEPKFLIKDGGAYADRFFLREDGVDTDLTVTPDGRVPGFIDAAKAQPGSEICVEDKARAGRPEDDEGLYFQMGLAPRFNNTPGNHSLAELAEGAKDGKAYYKKMAPAAFRILMPDTDHIAVSYEDKSIIPAISATKAGGETIPVSTELFDTAYIFAVDDIEDMDAVSVQITPMGYKMTPTPSVKTMRKFGFGGAQEKDESRAESADTEN